MEVSDQLHAMVCFTTGEKAHGCHWIAGWVAPRASLEVMRKVCASVGNQTLVIQSVAYSN